MVFLYNCRSKPSVMAHHFTTTHSHDYRWPHSNCLIPKAEAPNSHCESQGEGVKPWCERDAPPPPPRSELEPARACPDTAPIADRPWCQRGPLVPLISPPTSTPVVLKVRPNDCPVKNFSQEKQRTNGCSRPCQVPTKQKFGPKGCNEDYQSPLQQNLQSIVCFEQNQTNGNPRLRPEGCYEEPAIANRPWCEQDVITSVRVGAAPQQDTSLYNQPNQYLQQLCEKYPKPTSAITATPRDELMRRVYADRYRTTYQADYCKNGDDTARLLGRCDNHDSDQKLKEQSRLAPEGQLTNCCCGCGCSVAGNTHYSTVQSAGDSSTASPQPPTCRPGPVSHNVHFSCCYTKRQKQTMQGKAIAGNEAVGPPEKLPPWISEYSDSIGRTGQVIIDQKLHSRKSKKTKF